MKRFRAIGSIPAQGAACPYLENAMDTLVTNHPLTDHSARVARLLRAMANARRLQALYLLSEEGELSVGAIAVRLSLSHSALSQHLAVMRDDGLVARRRVGTTVFYRIADERVDAVLALMRQLHCDDQA